MAYSAETTRTTNEGSRWRAFLELELEHARGSTLLRNNFHRGPLRVQRALYPEHNGTCHLYVLHPPGGLVQGDALDVRLSLGAKARALVTTPGATKCYRSEGAPCHVSTFIRVAAGAVLEWLPQETILFDGARLTMATTVELAEEASFVGWDITCLGRPAAAEAYGDGFLDQSLSVSRGGVPLLGERFLLEARGEAMTRAWGCDGAPVLGTLVAAIPGKETVDAVRAADIPEVWGSELEGISVFRCTAQHTDVARRSLIRVWDVVRTIALQVASHRPRIWLT